jgi:Antibiotic biosynthesis monooxygenase
MVKFIEMDEQVTFSKQMEGDVGGPVILINKFAVSPEDVDQFQRVWTADASIFKQQPGYISAQLQRVLKAAELSSTTRFGSLWQCTKRPLAMLTFRPDFRTTCQHSRISSLVQERSSFRNLCGLGHCDQPLMYSGCRCSFGVSMSDYVTRLKSHFVLSKNSD